MAHAKPLLCYVTDRRSLAASSSQASSFESLLQKIAAVVAAGVDWIQLREKDLSARACATLVRDAVARTSKLTGGQPATRILVNDRLDVALASSAGGVHLGEQSISAFDARRLISSQEPSGDFLIGVSCHSLEAARSAVSSGADYIFFGPVFATPSKAEFGAPQGLARLREVCLSVNLPVIAIGGITLENAPSCLAAGASGVAAIRLFQDAPEPVQLIRALRKLA